MRRRTKFLQTHEGFSRVGSGSWIRSRGVLPLAQQDLRLGGDLCISKVRILNTLRVHDTIGKVGTDRNHIFQVGLVHAGVVQRRATNVRPRKVSLDEAFEVEHWRDGLDHEIYKLLARILWKNTYYAL